MQQQCLQRRDRSLVFRPETNAREKFDMKGADTSKCEPAAGLESTDSGVLVPVYSMVVVVVQLSRPSEESLTEPRLIRSMLNTQAFKPKALNASKGGPGSRQLRLRRIKPRMLSVHSAGRPTNDYGLTFLRAPTRRWLVPLAWGLTS